MTNNNIFSIFTGRLLVKIKDIGEITAEGGNWTIFSYICIAYKQISGFENFCKDKERGVKSWRIVRSYFFGHEGVVEVRKVMVNA